MKYKAVLFDMDGTILNTLEDIADSTNYILERNSYPIRSLEEIKSFVGNGIRRLLELSLPNNCSKDIIDEVFAEFIPYYKNHCADKTKPYDGIIELIKYLKDKGCKVAVVSNKANSAVIELCNRYFNGMFDYSIGEKSGTRKKPYPDSVNETLKKLGVINSEAVYVGDSEVDIQTAHNAGMECIAVSWGFRNKEVLVENGADIIVSIPEEIKTHIS